MELKSFAFGLGMGLVFLSLLFGLIYYLDAKEKAVALQKAVAAQAVTLSDAEIIEKARELGLVSITEIPEKEETNEVDEEAIIEQALTLGMIFPAEEETEEPAADTFASDEAGLQKTAGADAAYVTVRIPPGISTDAIAELLARNSIVADAVVFRTYAIQQGKSRRIRAGLFKLPRKSSDEEILRILTAPPED